MPIDSRKLTQAAIGILIYGICAAALGVKAQPSTTATAVPIAVGKDKLVHDIGGRKFEVFTYKPAKYADGPLILVFHGMNRNADEYRDHAIGMADRFGAIVACARFDEERFPIFRYQLGGLLGENKKIAPKADWTWSRVPEIVAELRRQEGKPALPYYLIGHSAGGQFLGRMAGFVPSGAERVVVANAGSHLFPTRNAAYPFGFGGLPDDVSDDAAIRRYLSQPLAFYLGTKDVVRDKYLPKSDEAEIQGDCRFARGQSVFAAGKKLAAEKKWPFKWLLVEAGGVDHDHERMFDHEACQDALFGPGAPASKEKRMTREQASAFAKLALKGIRKEYPNKPAIVLNGDADVKPPRQVHPAFYGCYDWHSAVHGHWMLARLLRLYPDLPEAHAIRETLGTNLTADNLKAETEVFARPNMQSFERPYGWAWLLKLAEELHGWDDADAKEWSTNLRPLAASIAARYVSYFPKQTYPIRSGVHSSTALGLAFALDYAKAVGDDKLRDFARERALFYFLRDAEIPARWEPDGADFFSPSLMEADLMRRVLPAAEFANWFEKFLPGLAKAEPKSLLEPAIVTDRSDPQIVHLDGLNLSRAWCMRGIASALPKTHSARPILAESARRHTAAGLAHVASGDYAGEHWLASFAVFLLATPAPE